MLIGKSSEKLRLNPRKSWYGNIAEITTSATMRRPLSCSGRNRP